MKKWVKDHIGQLIVGIILILVTAVVTYWASRRASATQYLDYVVQKSESILKGAKEVGDTIKFTVNGTKVADVSELDIYLMNLTNDDYEDVPIIIELHPTSPLNIISTNYFDQNQSKELIEAYPLAQSQYVRFGYKIKILNRHEHTSVFSLRLLIEGNTLPEFKVNINKAGLEVREYDRNNYQLLPFYVNPIVIAAMLPSLLVALYFMFQVYWAGKDKKVIKKNQKIVIHKAEYTSLYKTSDVRPLVQQMVNAGLREFKATNDVWGDIDAGQAKQLRIEYSIDGRYGAATVHEGDTIILT